MGIKLGPSTRTTFHPAWAFEARGGVAKVAYELHRDPVTVAVFFSKVQGAGGGPRIITRLRSQLCSMNSISRLPFHKNISDIILTGSQPSHQCNKTMTQLFLRAGAAEMTTGWVVRGPARDGWGTVGQLSVCWVWKPASPAKTPTIHLVNGGKK